MIADMGKLHMIKLSVGTENVADLAAWHKTKRAQTDDSLPRHITRMWPKRADELLNGGSIFWVIKGVVLCRQQIIRLDEAAGSDGIRRCAIVLDPELHLVEATPKRAFQGWRYLPASEAPRDLANARKGDDALPHTLSSALAEIGVR